MSHHKNFDSRDFIFRKTALGEALDAAGLSNGKVHLVREERVSLLARANHDKAGTLPSIPIHLTPMKHLAA